MHATTSNGLSTVKAHELQKVHGLNEIAARQEPEWKKVLKRYLDPISLTIVSFPLCHTLTCLRLSSKGHALRADMVTSSDVSDARCQQQWL